MEPQRQTTLYEQLNALPENLVGEIIYGQLHTQPRPAGPHAVAQSILEMDIGSAYQRGRGGPGDWWIIDEPELHFVRDSEVLVPDIAGWRRETMPVIPRDHRFEVVPDWICEVLSPSTASKDREIKMPVYAHYGVHYAWLVEPNKKTLEAFRLTDSQWINIGEFRDNDSVNIEPFLDITIYLADLWC